MDYKTQRAAVTMLLGEEEFSFLNVISPFYLIAQYFFYFCSFKIRGTQDCFNLADITRGEHGIKT